MTESQELVVQAARVREILSAVDAQREASAMLVETISQDFDGGLHDLIQMIAAAVRTHRPALVIQRIVAGPQRKEPPPEAHIMTPLWDKPL